MDETTRKIIKNIAGTVLRIVIASLGGVLVHRGFVSQETIDTVGGFAPDIAGAGLIVVALVLGIKRQIHANKKTDAALAASSDLTRKEFEELYREGALPEGKSEK